VTRSAVNFTTVDYLLVHGTGDGQYFSINSETVYLYIRMRVHAPSDILVIR
jgi:hypothetical protein